MTDSPRTTPPAKNSLLPLLLLISLAVAGGGYWYLSTLKSTQAPPATIPATQNSQPTTQAAGQSTSQTVQTTGQASGQTGGQVPDQMSKATVEQPTGQSNATALPSANATGQPALLPGGNATATEQQVVLPTVNATAQPSSNATAQPAANATIPVDTALHTNATSPVLPMASDSQAPNSGAQNATSSQGAAAQDGAKSAKTSGNDGIPVIVYGKGQALTPEGNIVRGEVPDAHASVDTKRIYGDGRPGSKAEDSIVSLGFVDGLARFLAENYWPGGTHPLAKRKPISTADIKWANLKYGLRLEGFAVNQNAPETERQRVLHYILMPSMIKGLYQLYGERFIAALEHEALTRPRTLNGRERTLTGPETAQMFGLYASQARAFSGTMRSYLADAANAERVQAYLLSEESVAVAYQRYTEAMAIGSTQGTAARDYQGAVIRREQARVNVAAALRRNGNTGGLDTESLLFVAMWLHRRQPEDTNALQSLISVLDVCATRLDQEKERYSTMLYPSTATSAPNAADSAGAAPNR